jgi:hypothetical protein
MNRRKTLFLPAFGALNETLDPTLSGKSFRDNTKPKSGELSLVRKDLGRDRGLGVFDKTAVFGESVETKQNYMISVVTET